MEHTFDFEIEQPDAAATRIAGSLSPHDHAALESYLDKLGLLESSQPLQNKPEWTFRFELSGPDLRVVDTLPDDDGLAVLLHRLRPFVLKNEPTFFYKAAKIIDRCTGDAYVRRLLKQQRKLFDGSQFQNTVRVESDQGELINSADLLEDWLNAYEYHQDSNKRERVDKLKSSLPDNLVRAVVLFVLLDRLQAVKNVGILAEALSGRTERLPLSSPVRTAHWVPKPLPDSFGKPFSLSLRVKSHPSGGPT